MTAKRLHRVVARHTDHDFNFQAVWRRGNHRINEQFDASGSDEQGNGL